MWVIHVKVVAIDVMYTLQPRTEIAANQKSVLLQGSRTEEKNWCQVNSGYIRFPINI
jgi:hypothetical protein